MTWSRSFFTLAVLLSLIAAPLVHARDWYEYKSDNFTVYSDVSEKRVDALLRDLERFRDAVLVVTGTPDGPESSRLRVFYFNSVAEFENFSDSRDIVGFYRDTWDGPLIFSKRGSRRGMPGTGIMFHEYVHHLMRSRSNTTYPMWYSEGFAELMASAEFDNDRVTVGGFPDWRIGAFNGSSGRPLEVADLLKPKYESESGGYWNRFYGSAWLLTHYLQFGSLKDHPEYRTSTRNYLAALHDGADPITAFKPSFGITPEEMQKKVRSILRKRRLQGYAFNSTTYTKTITRQKLLEKEAYYLLADKALDVGEEELALKYLQKSLKQDPDWAPALSLLAVLENHKQEKTAKTAAATLVAPLTTLEISDYRTAINLSHYHLDLLQDAAGDGDGEWDPALQQLAIDYGKMALSLNAQSVPAYRYMWTAQMDGKNRVPALKTMMAAYAVAPGSLYINESVGFYLADTGRVDLAKPFLERVVSWSHPGRSRNKARELLDKLAQDESRESNAAGDNGKTSG